MSQYYDIIAYGILMLLFLMLSAIYDQHGALVPDFVTMPYALLGLLIGFLQGRYISAGIGALLIVVILTGYYPSWLKKLNRWFIRRSYKTDEEAEEEAIGYDREAEAFEEKHGKTMRTMADVLVLATFAVAGIGILRCFIPNGMMDDDGTIAKCIVTGVFILVWAFLGYNGMLPSRSGVELETAEEEEEKEPLELSAFGGADMIVFIGILGAYGFVGFIYGIVPTTALYILACVIQHFLVKDNLFRGRPFIPSIFAATPIRIILYITLSAPMMEVFIWANPIWKLI